MKARTLLLGAVGAGFAIAACSGGGAAVARLLRVPTRSGKRSTRSSTTSRADAARAAFS